MASRSRLNEYMKKQDAALVEDARRIREEAWDHSWPSVRNYSDLPCEKRKGFVQRLMQKLHDERLHAKHRQSQLSQKMRVRAADPQADVMPIVAAQDALTSAIEHYDDLLRGARILRKHTQKACRVKRR